MMIKRIALVAAVGALSFAPVAVASAQTAADCQFTGGLGSNSACEPAPQDDYSDIIWPNTPGFAPGLWPGSFIPDDALPGISAGPGGGR